MLKIAFDPIYAHPLPEGHRFPMIKYELIPEQLLHEGTITPDNIFAPVPVEEEIILLTHQSDYWNKLKNLSLTPQEERRTGFPLSQQLVQREITIAQGTIDCCYFALKHGIALNVAGGTHHAFTNKGEGFCLLNDIAIAANYLLSKGVALKILIVDLDVHQGNGTAEIFQNNPAVFTFSMHGKGNWPYKKERSDLDIELPDNTDDKLYLAILRETLPLLIEKEKPDFIFYLSGVDILETDKLGKLSVSKAGCKERDRFVFEQCIYHKLPVVVSMGGGYSPRVADIVDAHCNTFRLAKDLYF
ncbi:histone deacetylase [Solitalea sp. MAHUQ-68]|uniref:Histone deacetylase n=1 Tax=Solitalea agri TaxID=2953739 RepID=A0A9X2JAV5_9SPHI|nr:histone deacetylase [Solitalea agri]MCO4291308.1 histone deacetylase [Solitalea agri]